MLKRYVEIGHLVMIYKAGAGTAQQNIVKQVGCEMDEIMRFEERGGKGPEVLLSRVLIGGLDLWSGLFYRVSSLSSRWVTCHSTRSKSRSFVQGLDQHA